MPSSFTRATSWIVTRPWLSVLLILILSGVAIVGYTNPSLFADAIDRLASPAETEVDEGDTEYIVDDSSVDDITESSEFQAIGDIDIQGNSVLVVESDAFFTPDGSDAIRHVVDSLRELDYVASVFWMDQVPPMNAFGLPEPLLPRSDASPERFEASKRKALNHPFIVGTLVSPDATLVLLMIDLDITFVRADEDCMERLVETAERAVAKYPNVDMEFSVTGWMPINVTAMKSHEENNFLYQVIAYSMIGVMSMILFRGIIAVGIVALAPAMGVFWTLGFIQFLDYGHNPFNDVVLPVMVALVGFTDGVHLMVQIRRNRVSGMTPKSSAVEGIRQVGLACFLTSLTTAIGFGSLRLAEHEIVQQFGTCCAIGVFLSFVAVVTTIPLACSTWLGKRLHIGHDKSLVDKNLNKIGIIIDFVLARKQTFSLIGIATTVALLLVSMTLRPDEKTTNNLPMGSEVAEAIKKIDSKMGGMERGKVRIQWTDDIENDSPEIMTVTRKIEKFLASEPLIGNPVSIVKIINALPGSGVAEDRVSMAELLPGNVKRTYYSPEERVSFAHFTAQDLGIAKYGPVLDQLELEFENISVNHPEFSFSIEGPLAWRWKNLFQIVVDLATSLGVASFIIFIILSIVFRSLRIGLISIIPNIFPLTVAGAYLAITGQALEVVTVCAFTVCLGIAVDDTIHFLTRFYDERENGGTEEEIIRRAFIGVGTALIITTVVLVSGFMTVLFSDTRDHLIFAAMGAITISAALFGDLVFLPAILARFASNQHTESGQATNEHPA